MLSKVWVRVQKKLVIVLMYHIGTRRSRVCPSFMQASQVEGTIGAAQSICLFPMFHCTFCLTLYFKLVPTQGILCFRGALVKRKGH